MMENVCLSIFCGCIVLVIFLGANFAWVFIKNNLNFPSFICAAAMYKLSILMAFEVTNYLGVRNDLLVQHLLLVPILSSAFASFRMKEVERRKMERKREMEVEFL